eukprot:scaffold5728_cov28-Cyclotella_meneghiniana.AAC.2
MKFITALSLVVTFLSSTLALKFDEDVLNNTADTYADAKSIDVAKTTDESKVLRKFSLRGNGSQSDNTLVSTKRVPSFRLSICINKCTGKAAYAVCVADCLSNTAISDVEVDTAVDKSNELKKLNLGGNREIDNAQVSTTRASSRAVYCVNKCIGKVAYAECVEDCLSNTAISDVEVDTAVDKSNELKKLNLGGNREIDNAQVSTTRTTNDPVVICVNKCIPYRAFEACVNECLSSNAISDLANEATSVKSHKSKLDSEVHDNAQVSTK